MPKTQRSKHTKCETT